MQEQVNEKISLLIDDELESEQALSLLKTIQADEHLKLKIKRYQLISQVLKNEPSHLIGNDFANKIHQQLRNEPIYFLPAKKAGINWRKSGWAIAASLVLAVIWLTNKLDQQSNSLPTPQIAYIAPQPQNQSDANARLKDYLQAHDTSAYINNAPSAQPYARIVGYQQE